MGTQRFGPAVFFKRGLFHIASTGDISCSDPRNGAYATDVVSEAGGAAPVGAATPR